MLTFGIETSCDETSCAVLEGLDKIRSNVVSSSLFRHKPFGGVVPEIASRHCLEQIDIVYEEALREARVNAKDIDLVAVTQGPGLIGSILVGVSFAKALAYGLRKPLIGVNHLEAHLSANFISATHRGGSAVTCGGGNKEPRNYVGLLVSGGHTILTYHRSGRVTKIGETVDDAVGEAYDKVAKILGLGYPGGPVIDKLAVKGNPKAFPFTKPKQERPYDFSFSGIKTAVLYLVKNQTTDHRLQTTDQALDAFFIRNIAASFQNAAVTWLVEKTLQLAEEKRVRDVVVGGGVSANSELRRRLPEEGKKRGIKIWFPPFALTTDNAAMIARRGAELFKQGRRSKLTLAGEANLKMGR